MIVDAIVSAYADCGVESPRKKTPLLITYIIIICVVLVSAKTSWASAKGDIQLAQFLIARAVSGNPNNKVSDDPSQVVIIFGGMGVLNDGQQPYLACLVNEILNMGRKSGNLPPIPLADSCPSQGSNDLAKSLSEHANNVVKNVTLPLSAYKPTVNLAEFEAAFTTSQNMQQGKLKNLKETFEKVFTDGTEKNAVILSLVGSLEFMLDNSYGSEFSEHYFVAVSAILVLPGSGDILMLGNRLVEYTINSSAPLNKQGMDEEKKRKLSNFAEAYKIAIKGAMDSLSATMAGYGDWGKTREMVTRTSFNGDNLLGLFDLLPARINKTEDLCKAVSSCRNSNSKWCDAVEGLLAEGTTEALAAGGRAMAPPLSWSTWASNSEKLFMRSSTYGDRLKVRISVSPNSAARKLVPVVSVKEKDFAGETQYSSYRGYKSYVTLNWADTDMCKTMGGNGRFEVSAKVKMQRRTGKDFGTPPPADKRRTFFLLSIYDSLQELTKNANRLPNE